MNTATLSILEKVPPLSREDFARAAETLRQAGHEPAPHLPILLGACGPDAGQAAWLPRVTGWLISALDAVKRGGGDPAMVEAGAHGLQDPYWFLELLATLLETGAVRDADVPEVVAALGTALRTPLPVPERDEHRQSFRYILGRICGKGLLPGVEPGRAIAAIDAIDRWRRQVLGPDDFGAADAILLLLADNPAAGAERLAAFHRAMVTAHSGHRARLWKALSGNLETGERAGKTEAAIVETVCGTRSGRLRLLTTILSLAWSGRVTSASVREACVLIRRLPGEEAHAAELWRSLLRGAGDGDTGGTESTDGLRRIVDVLDATTVTAGQLLDIVRERPEVRLDPDRLVEAARVAVAAKRKRLDPVHVGRLISKTWLTQEVLPATGEKGLDLIAAVADRMRRHGSDHGGASPSKIKEACLKLSAFISVANPTPFALDAIAPRCLALAERGLVPPPMVNDFMNPGITERARDALGRLLDAILEVAPAFPGDPDDVLEMLDSAARDCGVRTPDEMRSLARNIRAMPDQDKDSVEQAVLELSQANQTLEDLEVALELQWQIIARGLYPTRKMLVQLHAAPEEA
jgi:hypothetical protein